MSRQEDFRLIFRKGKKMDFSLLRVIVLPNRLTHARIAVITPRSAEKHATRRNLVRRRSWEWLRKNTDLFSRPLDFILSFKKEAFHAPQKKFYEEIARAANFLSGSRSPAHN